MNYGRVFLCVACAVAIFGCQTDTPTQGSQVTLAQSESLLESEVARLLAHSVEAAEELGEAVVVSVVDREGNELGVFEMAGSGGDAAGATQKARTAAFLSSNQHGFTTLTACFITRDHYPPGVPNLPGGPLYGVPFSSLPGGDVQPNGSGLAGAPGGVPLFENGELVGGLGIDGSQDTSEFDLPLCAGILNDEVIAFTGSRGFHVPADEQGDAIFVDGIQLLYRNGSALGVEFSLDPIDLPLHGSFLEVARDAPTPRFPDSGEVDLGLAGFDYRVRAGSALSADEVGDILDNAVGRAEHTRAAIRRPLGSSARVFVTVCDVDGSILGIVRTSDATLFSYDVSAQKARTALAFSDPTAASADARDLNDALRAALDLPDNTDMAVTTRAVGFLSQAFFPPGIDESTLDREVQEGPLFMVQDGLGLKPYGNGITVFPGGIPLYKGSQLVGAIGVSGDGVDQDGYIAAGGARGYEPPVEIRCDQFFYQDVRLPYVKFPRQPDL